MKKTLRLAVCILVCSLFSNTPVSSQIVVNSTNGYSVNIVVLPKAIVPTSSSCVNGFNYNVRFDYAITFSGSNIPSSMYTLQGTLGCGSNSHFFDIPNNQGSGTVTSRSNVWRGVSDCNTATLASLSCNIINIEIHGPGISSRTVSYAVSASPLPVTLVSFTAEAAKEKVNLKWSTATEINSDKFTIERSADGNNWTAVKTVRSAGNSSVVVNYEAADEHPVKGTSYYRLKQTDFDGTTEYSATRSVKFTGTTVIDVYPVPNSGNTINFRGIAEPKQVLMTVRNAAGTTVFSSTLSANSAQLPVLAAGLYMISLDNKITGEHTNLRYIKL